jgi:hypothetical protein
LEAIGPNLAETGSCQRIELHVVSTLRCGHRVTPVRTGCSARSLFAYITLSWGKTDAVLAHGGGIEPQLVADPRWPPPPRTRNP